VHGEGHVLPLATQLGQGSHRFDNSGKHADHRVFRHRQHRSLPWQRP
jgi:hypothetical protein